MLLSNPILLGAICIFFGHHRLLQYLITNHSITPNLYKGLRRNGFGPLAIAAEIGCLDTFKILEQANVAWNRSTYVAASAKGHLHVLKYIHETRSSEPCTPSAMKTALAKGHVDVARWLYQNRPDSINPLLTILDYAEFRIVRNRNCSDVEVVRFLHEEMGLSCSLDAVKAFAEDVDLDIVEYMIQHRDGEYEDPVLEEAATTGADAFVATVIGRNIVRAWDAALDNGNLKSIRFLCEKFKSDMPKHVVDLAVKYRFANLDCVKLLCELCLDVDGIVTTDAMDEACQCGDLIVLKYLHYNRKEGCTTNAFDLASGEGYLDVVRFLHGNTREGGTVLAMDLAASNGCLKVLKWLHENRKEGCSKNALDGAAREG
ncbi:hypothetical protein HDU76_011457, partial [Blyttiomyces sp. JEL0837]